MKDQDDPDQNHQRAAALRASVRDVRRLLDQAPGPLDGSPMGGILESLRVGLAGNLQADRDAALYNRSMGADRHHVKAALHALMVKALNRAPFFDALAFELTRTPKECRPKERVCRASDLRSLYDWMETGDVRCMARDEKGRQCTNRRRDGEPLCRPHTEQVERGEMKKPSPVSRVTSGGDEYQRAATLQDVERRPKPGHRWERDEHSWQTDKGRWVPVVDADEMNWAAVEQWEERAKTPAPDYAIVLAWVPVLYTQAEIADYMEQHVTVNQVRAIRQRPALPPLPEPDGSMTVTAYRERIGTSHAEGVGCYIRPKDVERAIDRYCDIVRSSEAFSELFAMSEHGKLRLE